MRLTRPRRGEADDMSYLDELQRILAEQANLLGLGGVHYFDAYTAIKSLRTLLSEREKEMARTRSAIAYAEGWAQQVSEQPPSRVNKNIAAAARDIAKMLRAALSPSQESSGPETTSGETPR